MLSVFTFRLKRPDMTTQNTHTSRVCITQYLCYDRCRKFCVQHNENHMNFVLECSFPLFRLSFSHFCREFSFRCSITLPPSTVHLCQNRFPFGNLLHFTNELELRVVSNLANCWEIIQTLRFRFGVSFVELQNDFDWRLFETFALP